MWQAEVSVAGTCGRMVKYFCGGIGFGDTQKEAGAEARRTGRENWDKLIEAGAIEDFWIPSIQIMGTIELREAPWQH